MTVLAGFVPRDAEAPYESGYLTLGVHDFEFLDWPPRQSIVTHDAERTAFAITTHFPVSPRPARDLDALVPVSYLDDFYFRIHVIPHTLQLGNFVSEQITIVDVWNAYFVSEYLTGTTTLEAGQSLIGPTIPKTFAALEYASWDFHVSPDGPSVIDTRVYWFFDGIPDPWIDVTGDRIVPWFVPPNWDAPLVERIEFSTDVVPLYDGSEQRFALRADTARWFWEFGFDVNGRAQRVLENALFSWGGQVWALPIWAQGMPLQASVSPGDTVLAIDTADLDFRVGGIALLSTLMRPDVYEAFEVAAVEAHSVTAARGLVRAWTAGPAMIYPARTARLTQTPTVSRFTGSHLSGTASFQVVDSFRRDPLTESTTYRGYPVQLRADTWENDPSVDYPRKGDLLDFGSTEPLALDEAGMALPTFSAGWTFTSRSDLEAFRQWLFARRGKQRALWLPSFAQDLLVAHAVDSASTTIEVEFAAVTSYLSGATTRRDLRIEMLDGTVYYRRVSLAAVIDEDTERLTIDAPLGVTYQPADFALVSWMALVRLDTDSIEIAHFTGEVSTASATFRAPRHNA